jgi:RiboL-PSP-HEPN
VTHAVIEEIVASNDWRDGEFAKFKMPAPHMDEAMWCRMCIPMIYAHWEGFVVSAFKIMLQHLNGLQLDSTQVPTKLFVLCMGDAYGFLNGKQSFEQKVEFTEKFNSLLKKNIKFTTKIKTESNLKSEVLEKQCLIFGFDFAKFGNERDDIDRLVHIRNSIAHGENGIVVDIINVNKYIDAVKNAMEILQNEINNFLENERYLKNGE